ncbi:AEC family transporter [Ornithinibacillus sp. 4-3]|uniref:AEC family transporter n=1 Tax=Ornithinibacillus sp. 4-3 TaxID=3231488 RepID=A0AB39HMU5_9BACI
MGLFFSVVLPIVSIFGLGYILQRIRVLDVKSVSTVAIYIFLPALAFNSLYNANFNKGFTIVIIFAFSLLFCMIVLNKILAKIFKWPQSVESASILTTAFMNGGNYGVPVIIFVLPEAAVAYGVFFMVLQQIIMNSFGVYYASRSRSGALKAVKTVFKMPATYAVILAFLCQGLTLEVPASILSVLEMLGAATIPIMMVNLGMQLASITSLKFNWQVITSATIIRMVISPLLALGFVALLDVEPMIASVIIIVASMPSAATTTLLALEFDTEPDLVSSITLVTTLISVVSLTVLLNFI